MEITTTEAAKRLGISGRRIRAMVAAGQLRSRRMALGDDRYLLLIEEKSLANVKNRKPGRPKRNNSKDLGKS